MKQNAGFALPAALLIMVTVLALAVGTMFISQTNLTTATHITTASTARHNADATLTLALHALSAHVAQAGQLPDDLRFADNIIQSIPNWPADREAPQFTLDRVASSYDVNHAAGTATIRITGTGPNQARYDTEATVRLTSSNTGTPMIHPIVAHGITAGGTAAINGSGTLIDAGMHGNKGYRMNVDPRHSLRPCSHRNSDGTCHTHYSLPHNIQVPITAAEGLDRYEFCGPAWFNEYCHSAQHPKQLKPDPFTSAGGHLTDFDPSYDATRNAFLCDFRTTPGNCDQKPTISDLNCNVTLPNYPSMPQPAQAISLGFTPGNTVCVNGNVALPNGIDLTGINVIARGNISFNGSPAAIENTSLVSLTGDISFNGNADFKNVRIFAEDKVTTNGSFTYEGTITLASKDAIRFNGATRNPDGTARMALISDGDININGSAGVWAAFLAGGDISINGSATIYGGLISAGDTRINGSLFLDSGIPFENPDLPRVPSESTATVLEVVSRR